MDEKVSPLRIESYVFYLVVFLILPIILSIQTPRLIHAYNVQDDIFWSESEIILSIILFPIFLPILVRRLIPKMRHPSNPFFEWNPDSESLKKSVFFIRLLTFNIGANYYILSFSNSSSQASSAPEFITTIAISLFLFMSMRGSTDSGGMKDGGNFVALGYVQNLVHEIYPKVNVHVVNSEKRYAYFKFLFRNRIYISKGMLRSSPVELRRVIYHELGHKQQGFRVISASLFLLFYFLILGELLPFISDLQPSHNSPLFLVYFLLLYFTIILIPYFSARYLNWTMEIDAEYKSAQRLGKLDYYKAVGPTLNHLRQYSLKGEKIFGSSTEKYYCFYPPPYIQISEAVKRMQSNSSSSKIFV